MLDRVLAFVGVGVAGDAAVFGPQPAARPATVAAATAVVDAAVTAWVAHETAALPANLASACRTATAGGKRLRALLALDLAYAGAALAGRAPAADPRVLAVAAELIHAASLVIDDLPAFDNDRVRRGAPAVWAAHGVAAALMAAQTLVFSALKLVHVAGAQLAGAAPAAVALLPAIFGTEYGGDGAAAAQYAEHELARGARGPPAVQLTAGLAKTAPFFAAAAASGWLASGAGEAGLGAARDAGRSIGAAFQLLDDLADADADAAAGRANLAAGSRARRAAVRAYAAAELAVAEAALDALCAPAGAGAAAPLTAGICASLRSRLVASAAAN